MNTSTKSWVQYHYEYLIFKSLIAITWPMPLVRDRVQKYVRKREYIGMYSRIAGNSVGIACRFICSWVDTFQESADVSITNVTNRPLFTLKWVNSFYSLLLITFYLHVFPSCKTETFTISLCRRALISCHYLLANLQILEIKGKKLAKAVTSEFWLESAVFRWTRNLSLSGGHGIRLVREWAAATPSQL